MAKQMFLNLPVKSLPRAVAFFEALGFRFDPRFSNEDATAMVVGEGSYVMLLVEPFFATFTPKPIADAHASTEVIVCLAVDTRAEVDSLVDRARAEGALPSSETRDLGFMYQRGFQDLDGHLWEFVHMESPPPSD